MFTTNDEVKQAKTNVILQLVLLVPALIVLGFTTLNIITSVFFLVVALLRLARPTEGMRKFEFRASLVGLVLWLLLTVVL